MINDFLIVRRTDTGVRVTLSLSANKQESSSTRSVPTQREDKPRQIRWLVPAIIVLAAAIVAFSGLLAEVSVGDEVYHFGFARAWAEAGLMNRPVHPPQFESGHPPGYFYVSEPLWPFGLAALWQVLPRQQWVAQLYQAMWYALMLTSVYLLARHVRRGREAGVLALLLAVSVPMMGVYATLLYIDIAAAALITLALFLAVRRNYVLCGIVLGLTYLTKRNAIFMAPPIALMVVHQAWQQYRSGKIGKRLLMVVRSGLLLVVPSALVVLPDMLWRRSGIFPAQADPANSQYVLQRLSIWMSNEKLPSSLINPVDWVTHVGPLLLVGLVATFAAYLWRKQVPREDRWLVLIAALYAVALIMVFSLNTDLRYLMPAVPLLAVIAGRHEFLSRRRWLMCAVAIIAVMQLGGASMVAARQRYLPAENEAVFAYLRDEAPDGTFVLYPGEVIMARTGNPFVWSNLFDPGSKRTAGLGLMFYKHGNADIEHTLRHNNVKYLVVDEKRVFDPTTDGKHMNGWPQPFVDRLPQMPFLRRVDGPWSSITVWEVIAPAEVTAGDGQAEQSGPPSDEDQSEVGIQVE